MKGGQLPTTAPPKSAIGGKSPEADENFDKMRPIEAKAFQNETHKAGK